MELFLNIKSIFLGILLYKSAALTSDASKEKVQKSLCYEFDSSSGQTSKARDLYIHRLRHRPIKKHSKRENSLEKEENSHKNKLSMNNMNMPVNMLAQPPMQNMVVLPLPIAEIQVNSSENFNGMQGQLIQWLNPVPVPPWPGSGWSVGGFPPGVPPVVSPGIPPAVPPGLPPWWPGLGFPPPENQWEGMPPPGIQPNVFFKNGWPPNGSPGLPANLKPEDFLPDSEDVDDMGKNFENIWPEIIPMGILTVNTGQITSLLESGSTAGTQTTQGIEITPSLATQRPDEKEDKTEEDGTDEDKTDIDGTDEDGIDENNSEAEDESKVENELEEGKEEERKDGAKDTNADKTAKTTVAESTYKDNNCNETTPNEEHITTSIHLKEEDILTTTVTPTLDEEATLFDEEKNPTEPTKEKDIVTTTTDDEKNTDENEDGKENGNDDEKEKGKENKNEHEKGDGYKDGKDRGKTYEKKDEREDDKEEEDENGDGHDWQQTNNSKGKEKDEEKKVTEKEIDEKQQTTLVLDTLLPPQRGADFIRRHNDHDDFAPPDKYEYYKYFGYDINKPSNTDDNQRYGKTNKVPYFFFRPTQIENLYKTSAQTKRRKTSFMPKYGVVKRVNFKPKSWFYRSLF